MKLLFPTINFKHLLLGVLPVTLMGCGTGSQLVGGQHVVSVHNVAAAGHRVTIVKPTQQASIKFVSRHQAGFVGAPSIGDTAIYLNVAAAFTRDIESLQVCGDHVVCGELIKGYDDVTATGHMLIIDDKVSILPNSRLRESLRQAVAGKGYLFQQCHIVQDGQGRVERIPQAIRERKAHIIYRAVCTLGDGSVAIVQGDEPMYCHEFIDALVHLGAQQALYLDMGTWAWGWLREQGKPAQELAEHFFNTRFQSNWLQITTK